MNEKLLKNIIPYRWDYAVFSLLKLNKYLL